MLKYLSFGRLARTSVRHYSIGD